MTYLYVFFLIVLVFIIDYMSYREVVLGKTQDTLEGLSLGGPGNASGSPLKS